jgi:recombination protein RecA
MGELLGASWKALYLKWVQVSTPGPFPPKKCDFTAANRFRATWYNIYRIDTRTNVRYNVPGTQPAARYVALAAQEGSLAKKRNRSRQRQLDMAVATIHRRFGARSLLKGRPVSTTPGSPPHISTGFPALDRALGIGGLPRGRMCELVGPATSGKTTLALKFLAQAQAGGGQVAYVDQALYFDPDYAHRCGLDLSRLLVGTSHDLREALAATEALVRSGGLSAMVFDSLDFLWTDAQAAALLAATLNRLPAALSRANTTLLILHETAPAETATGASGELPSGNSPPGEVPVGAAPALSTLSHSAAVRLQVVRERWVRRHGDVRGYKARVEVLKNRLGPAGRVVNLTIDLNGTVRGNGL